MYIGKRSLLTAMQHCC